MSAEICKHPDTQSTQNADLGIHVTICKACFGVTHVCLNPLHDDVEKDLEKVREWGVFYAKAVGNMTAKSAVIMQDMERAIRNFRTAMFQARADKNTTVEGIAKFLEEMDRADAASIVRTLKANVSIGEPEAEKD